VKIRQSQRRIIKMAVEEMRRQKLSMRKLSLKAGLGGTTLKYLLQNADTLTIDTMCRIAAALGLCVVYLTYGVHRVVVPSEADPR
jgi:hypothetical protein